MAHMIAAGDKNPFPARQLGRYPTLRSYPWHQWLNGEVWCISIEEDLCHDWRSFRSFAYSHSLQEHYKPLRIRQHKDPETGQITHLYLKATLPLG